jgi:hypothetical protein
MTISSIGNELQVTLNGQLIQDLDLEELSDRPNSLPGLVRKSGRIGFQSHTGTVRFRHIEIKVLN